MTSAVQIQLPGLKAAIAKLQSVFVSGAINNGLDAHISKPTAATFTYLATGEISVVFSPPVVVSAHADFLKNLLKIDFVITGLAISSSAIRAKLQNGSEMVWDIVDGMTAQDEIDRR